MSAPYKSDLDYFFFSFFLPAKIREDTPSDIKNGLNCLRRSQDLKKNKTEKPFFYEYVVHKINIELSQIVSNYKL